MGTMTFHFTALHQQLTFLFHIHWFVFVARQADGRKQSITILLSTSPSSSKTLSIQ